MKIALAQIDSSATDLETNLQTHIDRTEEALATGANLIVFPELSLSGDNTGPHADPRRMRLSPDDPRLSPLLKLSERIDIALGVLEYSDGEQYNAAFYLHNGAIQHVHRKVFLANYATFNEKGFAVRGEQANTFQSQHGRTSILVCNDCWHPILPYMAALEKTTLLLAPSNSAWSTMGDQLAITQVWENINRSYAGMFGMYVVFVNRVGARHVEDADYRYWGGSEIIGPNGQEIIKAPYDEETLIYADIDLDTATKQQQDTAIFADLNPDLVLNRFTELLG